jgi:hypothetical protein
VSAENQVLKIVENQVAGRVLVRIYLIHNHLSPQPNFYIFYSNKYLPKEICPE